MGRHRSYASLVRRSGRVERRERATDGSSDESSYATVTCRVLAERWASGLPRGGPWKGRERRERVREAEPVGSNPCPPFHEERASVLRNDTMKRVPPMLRRRLIRVTRWGLGSRRSSGHRSAQVGGWRAKLLFGIEPESVVPPRATRDVRGRARPREAPPATRRGGSASGAIRSTVGGSERTHSGMMHRAMRARTKAGAFYRAPPRRDSPARTAGIVDSLLRPNGGDASST